MRTIRRTLPPNDMYSRRIQEFSGNLVAHWPLDERHGAVAYDKSIGGFNGTITTATPGVAGIGDGLTSMSFDGTNDYIDISAIASNLVPNGGFETAGGDVGGADNWTEWVETEGDGALANEAVVIHTGADACKMTAGVTRNTLVRNDFTVVAGGTYRFRFWTQGDGTNSLRYRLYDVSNANFLTATIISGITGAAYEKVDVDFTAPAGCTSIRLYFYVPNLDTAFCYIDTVSLRRTDIPTFDPHEGSVIVWAKVSAAGVWADGVARFIATLQVSATDRIFVIKNTGNNTIRFFYEGNDVADLYDLGSVSELGWFSIGITWSLSGDSITYHYDGSQVSSDSGVGTFIGQLASNTCVIGANTTAPGGVWDGNIAHAQIYNTPLSADEMKYLMTLP